jgi:hypothetical protein
VTHTTWRHAFDMGVGIAMLLLAFVGIGASDVSGAGSQAYWSLLAIGFAVASFAMAWVHAGEGFHWSRSIGRMAVHWIGVLAAIELVYVFIASGRVANANIGLVNGVILALGTFLAGVHANWRLMVIGAALGLATAVVAYLEQYLWVLFTVALLALAAIFVVARLRKPAAEGAA